MTPSPSHASQRPPRTLNEKRPGLVAARARLGHQREQVPDRREQAHVGRGVGARGPADGGLVDVDHLVEMLDARDRACGRRARPRPRGSARASARCRISLTSVLFPEPDTPVTQVSAPSGKRTVTSFRLCSVAPTTVSALAAARAPRRGRLDRAPVPTGTLPSASGGDAAISSGVPSATTSPPSSPAPGAQVHDVVGGADRLLVVLHHDHGVSQVAHGGQRVQQPPVVALVQPDRRLVQDVEDARQARADLRGQADALPLAAGEGGRPAVQASGSRAPRSPGSPAAPGSP